MNRRAPVLIGLVLLATSCGTLTSYQISDPLPAVARLRAGASIQDEVDRLAQPLVKSGQIYGIAVGVVTRDGRTLVSGYGRTGLSGEDQRPRGDTIFQLGSVSKVFIAAVLAVLVDEGALSYEDTIRSILPADVPLTEEVGKVTLYELATHTGGFPREPLSIRQLQNFITYSFTGGDVYAHIDKSFLYAYLRTCHLKPKERRRYEYSNIGYALLAHLMAIKMERSFPDLLEEKICRPLGMRDTSFILNPEQQKRLAIGHAGEQPRFMRRGSPIEPWDTSLMMGPVDGLYSTVNDLVIFAKANLGMLHHPLEPVLAATQRMQVRQPPTDQALGWQIDCVGKELMKITFKYGVVAGYHCYIGMNADARLAVVVLCNTFSREDQIGHNLVLRLSRGLTP